MKKTRFLILYLFRQKIPNKATFQNKRQICLMLLEA